MAKYFNYDNIILFCIAMVVILMSTLLLLGASILLVEGMEGIKEYYDADGNIYLAIAGLFSLIMMVLLIIVTISFPFYFVFYKKILCKETSDVSIRVIDNYGSYRTL